MRKTILTILVLLILTVVVLAQDVVYLPIIFKDDDVAQQYPILAINSESGERINLLDSGSGLVLADPYWQPNIAQLKGGGTFVNPQTADGRSLVNAKYSNVIETIPLRITGEQGWITIRNLRRMLNLSVNAQAYHTQIFEQDRVWLEIRADCDNHLTGYSTIYTISIPNVTSPYTRPFANPIDKSQFDTISIVLEREPFFSPLEPGEIIGPLYNLIKNPDFELWNFGISDSQPDSWDNLQSNHITGTNNRTQTDVRWNNNAIRVNVMGSDVVGANKGVTQVLEGIENNTTYTILAWVKNDGVSNGVGRILINYSSSLELYRDANSHGWQLYSGTITTKISDTVSINCEILSTTNHTDGTIFFDGLMFIEGDWEQEATDNLIGYMSGSNIVNHTDDEAGDLNYVDMWNIPGDVDAKIRLEMINNNNDDSGINYRYIRIGMRRTGNIDLFDNIHDPIGTLDTNSTYDNSLSLANPGENWKNISTKIIQTEENTEQNLGIFAAYARIKDNKTSATSDLDVRLFYFAGSDSNVEFLNSDTPSVLGHWTTVNLTNNKSINLNKKFDAIYPSQIGYMIQMKRDTSATVDFDYFIIIPTDGGFVDIDFGSNSLIPNTKLLIDSLQKITIQATDIPIGFNEIYTIPDANIELIHEFIEYLGDIYIAVGGTVAGEAQIYRYRNNQGNLVHNPGTYHSFRALEIFNSELYTGIVGGGAVAAPLYKTDDGITWTVAFDSFATFPPSIFQYYSLKAYKGYLYAGYHDNVPNDQILGRWDGTNFTRNLYTMGNVNARILDIENYKDKLYFGTATGLIIEYDVDSDIGNISHTIGGGLLNAQLDMTVYNDKLYVVASDIVSIYDNNEWVEVTVSTDIDINALRSIQELNDNLYAGGWYTIDPLNQAPLIISDDEGLSWETIYDALAHQVTELKTLSGILYIGVIEGTEVKMITITDTETFYTITEYKGGGFSAPPRTLQSDSRHRYFFSYDRENYVNNIDDKALIGIGYRPRYFSLINKDEF